jgi:DNA-binding response OmpR family regulator
MAAARVLVVDDEPIVREVLTRYLRSEGFEVETAANGEAALRCFDATEPDLILLDLMLPRIYGLEVFRQIRGRSDGTPVIMLTARGDETDRVVGLEMGADDYIAKPFSPREVVARVHAVLRRTRNEGARTPGVRGQLRFDGLVIDPVSREVLLDGAPVELTRMEFDLLHFLASNPRRVFSRLRLLDELWDVAFDGDPSTVTVHVRRVREKIEADPSSPRRLVTVWGSGYRFEP